jgi:hypothetical protein
MYGWSSLSSRYSERTTHASSSSDRPVVALQSKSRTLAPAASSACTSTRKLGHDSACAACQRLIPSKSSGPALVRQACTGVSWPSFESDSCICSWAAGAQSRSPHSDVPSSLRAISTLALGWPVMHARLRERWQP